MDDIVEETVRLIGLLLSLSQKNLKRAAPGMEIQKKIGLLIREEICLRLSIIIFAFISQLGKVIDTNDVQNNSISLFEKWKTSHFIQNAINGMGIVSYRVASDRQDGSSSNLNSKLDQRPDHHNPSVLIQSILSNPDVQLLMQINRYQEVVWYSREGFYWIL
jgi:hypothetical protein